MAPKQEKKEKEKKGPSLLEWISAAVGAVVAIGLLGFLALEIADPAADTPPLLQVRPSAIVAGAGLYVVEIEVANRSGKTAAAVQIEGELKQGAATVETSTATLGFVPGQSERKAGLVFSRDPRRYRFEARATGYEEP